MMGDESSITFRRDAGQNERFEQCRAQVSARRHRLHPHQQLRPRLLAHASINLI